MNELSPAFFARLSKLQWPIHKRLQGYAHGAHRGQNRGAGLEFSEYRRYELGDDLRRLDWKLLARSDRYYLREAERDSQISVFVILDASLSMTAKNQKEKNSRLQTAKMIAGGLISIATRQGDEVGLIAVNDVQTVALPARRGMTAMKQLLSRLMNVQAQGKLPSPRDTKAVFGLLDKPSLCVFISDFIDDMSLQWLRLLQAANHQLVALSLSTNIEREFLFSQSLALVDETPGNACYVNIEEQKEAYLQAYQSHQQRWQRWCGVNNVAWHSVDVDDDAESVVRQVITPTHRRQRSRA